MTTRKRSEKLTRVPISVTAITKRELRERGIKDVKGVADFSPGFRDQSQTVNRNDRGFQAFAIRGIPSLGSARPSVGIFLDGTPIAGGNISGINDIDHVEVIRGPQAAYFGRSTFAGAVNFVTRPPGDALRGSLDAEYGSYDTTDDSGEVEGAIIPGILDMRVGGRHYRTAGQYNDALEPGVKLGERETNSGTLELRATPTDSLTLNYFFNYWTDDDGPAAQALLTKGYYTCNAGYGTAPNYFCGGIGSTPQSAINYNTLPGNTSILQRLTGPTVPVQRSLSPTIVDNFGLSRRAFETHLSATQILPHDYTLSANVARDSNHWSEINDTLEQNTFHIANPNYGKVAGVLPYVARSALADAPDDDFSAEARLASPQNGRFKWMLGYNYYQQRSAGSTVGFTTAGFAQFSGNVHSNIGTNAVFASTSYELFNKLTLSLEGRGQWDRISSYADMATGEGPLFAETYPSFSPRAILSYQVTPSTMLYTSYSRGYRPGEFNTIFSALTATQKAQIVKQLGQVATAVPEEKINMLEAGFKGLYFHNRLRLMADAYYGDWSNWHITDQVQTTTNNVITSFGVVIPGGRVLLHGVEAEAEFAATNELTVSGTFDYAATNIRRDFCAVCATINGNVNNTGSTLPNYPTYSATVSATYHHPLFHGRVTGFIHGDWIYAGRMYADDTNLVWIKPSNRLNGTMGIQFGRYEIAVVGTNLTNNKVPTNISQATDGLGGNNDLAISPADKPYVGARLHVTL